MMSLLQNMFHMMYIFRRRSFITYCLINTLQRKWLTHTPTDRVMECNCFISCCQLNGIWSDLIESESGIIVSKCLRWLCIPLNVMPLNSACHFCFVYNRFYQRTSCACARKLNYAIVWRCRCTAFTKLKGMCLGLNTNPTINSHRPTMNESQNWCRCSSFKMCHKFSVWCLIEARLMYTARMSISKIVAD